MVDVKTKGSYRHAPWLWGPSEEEADVSNWQIIRITSRFNRLRRGDPLSQVIYVFKIHPALSGKIRWS